jgi:hypothetical protein
VAASVLVPGLLATAAGAQDDPRNGLGAGWLDAEEASSNMELLAHRDKPAGFFSPTSPGSLSFANSDMAYSGDHAYVGNFHGFQIYDVSDPTDPTLLTQFVCPGGQGDLSVYGDLLFMSVEETRGRVDCGTQGNGGGAQPDRFRGVRIFDISDRESPVQLPGIQSCKGSHTHTLVADPEDTANVYVYISGTASIRNAAEAPGACTGASSLLDPNTDNFSITVAKVPLAAPHSAQIVNRNARVLSTCGDNSCQDEHASGALNGLPGSGVQPTYPADSPRAPGGQSRSQSSTCHDLTAYPAIGLMAGACQGHGILVDISDPENPRRIDAVEDYNFAYWHSATFNNAGTKVIFTDEWGGGTGARCRPGDRMNWGANAIFDIVNGKMEFRSYYKLPVTQTNQENCVAHNGSLVPVPDRDLMVQAWYQGGISVFDFTDSANPHEIAFFDRGPMHATSLQTGGFWSAYYYNGKVYGSEIGRGFDTLALTPSQSISQAALDVAATVQLDQFNAQHQPQLSWPASFPMVDYRFEQVMETGTLKANKAANVQKMVDKAQDFLASGENSAAKAQLQAAGNQLDIGVPSQAVLRGAISDLRATIP